MFQSIIGNKKQLKIIESEIKTNNLPQAYLLTGPSQIGKTTIAKKIATLLQCPNNTCKKCSTCIQIEKNIHQDTSIYKNTTESIKIKQIKNLQEKENKTTSSKYNIFIIKDIERMTTAAANSFLKTLEEPNPKTIFILTSSKPEKLLKTIISRTRILKFQIPDTKETLKTIKKQFPEKTKQQINEIFKYTNKTPGNIISILKDTEKEIKLNKTIETLKTIINSNSISAKFKIVEELTKQKNEEEKAQNKEKINSLISVLTNHYRIKLKEEPKNITKNIKTLLKITDTGILLKKNVNKKITLENLMLEI